MKQEAWEEIVDKSQEIIEIINTNGNPHQAVIISADKISLIGEEIVIPVGVNEKVVLN